MKVSLKLALFGLLATAHAFAVPPRSAPSANETLIPIGELANELVRRDEEWTMVLYNGHASGGQCGGTSTTVTGDNDRCEDITNKKCADLKVNANVGIASCSFDFKSESCGGPRKKWTVVQGGKDSNGVDLSDDVKFVSVSCSLGG